MQPRLGLGQLVVALGQLAFHGLQPCLGLGQLVVALGQFPLQGMQAFPDQGQLGVLAFHDTLRVAQGVRDTFQRVALPGRFDIQHVVSLFAVVALFFAHEAVEVTYPQQGLLEGWPEVLHQRRPQHAGRFEMVAHGPA